MDLPESSTKRPKLDVDSIAPALASLPSPLIQPVEEQDVKVYLNEDGSFYPSGPSFEKGTTAIAFIFDEGIMLSFDHSGKSAKNFVPLNSHMLATISGGSEFLLEELREKCQEQERKEGRRTPVKEALKWLTHAVTAYEEELPIGILIASFNESEPGLYRMNGQGLLIKDSVHATGSGSAASILVEIKGKPHMSIPEAADLAKTAICMGAYRAPHSGDSFSVYHLGRGGYEKLLDGEIEEWHKKYDSPKWKYVVIGPGWSEA